MLQREVVLDAVPDGALILLQLRERIGDAIVIYHTGDEKAVVGLARAASDAYPDPGKKDPKLLVFDIEAEKAMPRPVTLREVKADPKLRSFDLVRLPRLSVMPVSDDEWRAIEGMAK